MSPLRAALLIPAALVALSALNTAQAGGGGPRPAPVATCRDGYVRPDFTALKAQLSRARTQWNVQRPASYTYDLRQIAAPVLFPETRVTVVGGRVTRTDLLPGQEGNPTTWPRRPSRRASTTCSRRCNSSPGPPARTCSSASTRRSVTPPACTPAWATMASPTASASGASATSRP
ncbi:hypothetical protein [Deinococcus aquaticus]|uniref:hypothetical protein n=1 Tax=Deinococcus aquaticus TaxID=328692 RepID=UPI00360AE6E3